MFVMLLWAFIIRYMLYIRMLIHLGPEVPCCVCYAEFPNEIPFFLKIVFPCFSELHNRTQLS